MRYIPAEYEANMNYHKDKTHRGIWCLGSDLDGTSHALLFSASAFRPSTLHVHSHVTAGTKPAQWYH